VLRATVDLRRRRPLDPADPPPSSVADGTWAFLLEPLDGGRTRMIVRARGTLRPWPLKALNLILGDPAHHVMQHRQFHNLKRRVERTRPAGWPMAVTQ
jgi:hypothetical protein